MYGLLQARLPASDDGERGAFLVTPGDRLFDEVTPANLAEVGPKSAPVNVTADVIHAAIYEARPDVRAIVHHHTPAVVAASIVGLQFLTQDASAFFDSVAYHEWEGVSDDYDEKSRIAAALGPKAHTLMMRHHGAVTTGSTVAEAWVRYFYLDRICQVWRPLQSVSQSASPFWPPLA